MTINNGSTNIRVPLNILTPLMSETIDMPKDLLGIIGTYYNDPNIPAPRPYLPTEYTSMTDNLYTLTSEISNMAETSSGKQIKSALKTLSKTVDNFRPGSYLLALKKAVDKMTVHDDSLNLALRIQTCSQIVRTCLDNEQHLARYSETLDEAQEQLTDRCDQLDIDARSLIEDANIFASEMIIDRDALIDGLDDAIDLPTYILGATAEYSLGSTVTPLVHEAAQIPTDLAEIIEEYYIDPDEHIGS